jgi:hypothetical protein
VVSASACAKSSSRGGRKEKTLQGVEMAHFAEGKGTFERGDSSQSFPRESAW